MEKHRGERFLKYWNWFGIGIFIGVVSALPYFNAKIFHDVGLSSLILGLTVLILLILTGFFKFRWERSKNQKQGPQSEEQKQIQPLVMGRKSRISALKIEYTELTAAIHHRGSQYLTLESILISGSLVAIAAVIGNSSIDTINDQTFFAKGTLVAALSMVTIGWLLHITTQKIDKICWDRVHVIEKQLGIHGNQGIYKEAIDKKWWFILRAKLMPSLFAVLAFFYILGLAYYFNHINFPLLF